MSLDKRHIGIAAARWGQRRPIGRPTAAAGPRFAPLTTLLASAAGYLAFAELGYRLQDASSGLASFWPSAGLVVGLLVLLPSRLRGWCVAAVLLSEVTIDLLHGAPLTAGLGWGAIDTVEVVLTATVLVRVAGRRPVG